LIAVNERLRSATTGRSGQSWHRHQQLGTNGDLQLLIVDLVVVVKSPSTLRNADVTSSHLSQSIGWRLSTKMADATDPTPRHHPQGRAGIGIREAMARWRLCHPLPRRLNGLAMSLFQACNRQQAAVRQKMTIAGQTMIKAPAFASKTTPTDGSIQRLLRTYLQGLVGVQARVEADPQPRPISRPLALVLTMSITET
jgi:hypothetical protein